MMKLRFLNFAVAAVLCAGFVSCGDDDNDEVGYNPFVGVWDASANFGHDHVFEFQSNGEFEYVYYWDSHSYTEHICNKETEYGSYSYKPESKEFLLMYDDRNAELYAVSHIGDDKIILRDNSDGSIKTLTRKK